MPSGWLPLSAAVGGGYFAYNLIDKPNKYGYPGCIVIPGSYLSYNLSCLAPGHHYAVVFVIFSLVLAILDHSCDML